jgi:hypothetical protein
LGSIVEAVIRKTASFAAVTRFNDAISEYVGRVEEPVEEHATAKRSAFKRRYCPIADYKALDYGKARH